MAALLCPCSTTLQWASEGLAEARYRASRLPAQPAPCGARRNADLIPLLPLIVLRTKRLRGSGGTLFRFGFVAHRAVLWDGIFLRVVAPVECQIHVREQRTCGFRHPCAPSLNDPKGRRG